MASESGAVSYERVQEEGHTSRVPDDRVSDYKMGEEVSNDTGQ